MATPAQQYWHNAQRARRAVLKQVEQLKKKKGEKGEEAQLEAVERLLSDYRLACVTTIFADFKYAKEHDVENSLWQLHIFVNNEYRSLLSDLKVPQQIVTKRKVEKLYTNYLRTSQYFYRGYIQRLWARYDVPELGRIAQSMRLDSMPNATVDDEAGAETQTGVVKSCHATLLHLGDLSRYRHKMRQKLHGSETALTYYSLAQDLNPDSGFAHHQMGVIYLEEKNHLEIVYHFYRAWAVRAPHPNATNNLEVEFKTLLNPSTPGKRTGPPDPNAAFISWFVRLHARFFKGETFPEHAELEEEVLHRFETALKNPGTFSLLLKMVLINISAYYVAQAKIKNKWTLPGSTSCQFILRLNVRFVLVLSRLLKSELRDIVKAVLPMETRDHEKTAENPANFKPYAENILPLLRIYMTWVCTYRTDIVKYGEHLEPFAHDMYQTLGQALTLVIQEFLEQDLVTSSYLLPEDLEALGLNPLDDASLPSECRLHYIPDQDIRKPRPGDTGCIPTTPQQELLSRIYDILSCGYFLATDHVFPFTMITVHEESRDITAITFQEDGSSQQFDESTAEVLPVQSNSGIGELLGKFGDLQASPDTLKQKSRHTSARDSLGQPAQAQEIPASPGQGGLGSPTEIPQSASKAAAVEFESEFNIDREMYSLVNDFLAPPESRTDQNNRGGDETSYGMHSSTANDVFGSLQNKSPTPGSATMKTFPTLPWGFFISPAPHGPGQEVGATRGSEHEVPQQNFSGSPEGFAQYRNTRVGEDPFTGPNGLQSPFQDARRKTDAPDFMSTRYTSSTVEPNLQGAYARQTRNDTFDVPQNHKNLSERFDRLPAVSDSNDNRSGHNPWPAADAYARALDPSTTSSTAVFWQGSGLGAEKAAFSSSNFSQNASSLPPVNSPWGLPAARQTHTAQQSNMYPYSGTLADSSAHFSPPNSLYQSNGNYYNATTAFGRGPIANKDDPTHFKNAVKRTEFAAAVEAADAYDRAILAGALLDDKRPQR